MRLPGKVLLFLLCSAAVFAQVPVMITTASPVKSATLNRSYNLATANGEGIAAIGGDGGYLWTVVTPVGPAPDPNCPGPLTGLPPGLTLGTATGGEAANANITGTPTSTGTFTF